MLLGSNGLEMRSKRSGSITRLLEKAESKIIPKKGLVGTQNKNMSVSQQRVFCLNIQLAISVSKNNIILHNHINIYLHVCVLTSYNILKHMSGSRS